MSFSDFILALLVLAAAAVVLWVYDINPYTNKLQIYTQQCDNMILDNTYCKGTWQERFTETYTIDQQTQQVMYNTDNQTNSQTYDECIIQDRKNWSCNDTLLSNELIVKDGIVKFDKNSDIRQITRLQWLQNKILKFVN